MRQTSIETYNSIKNSKMLSKRRFEVYDIIFNHGPLTAHEVVKIARIRYPNANQTSFNARFSELKSLGCLIEVGVKINEVSNKPNYLWDTTNNLPKDFERPLTTSEKLIELQSKYEKLKKCMEDVWNRNLEARQIIKEHYK